MGKFHLRLFVLSTLIAVCGVALAAKKTYRANQNLKIYACQPTYNGSRFRMAFLGVKGSHILCSYYGTTPKNNYYGPNVSAVVYPKYWDSQICSSTYYNCEVYIESTEK